MQIGWIDFSKEERDKVLGVIESLTESGTLDELGIAPIRDGFADLFFPGTSTLQTHAKYFLLVPYACKDLEEEFKSLKNSEVNHKKLYKILYKIEKETSDRLYEKHSGENGIIGGGYTNNGNWVKRPPSNLYWAGLRRLKIFKENLSLSGYLKALCSLKADKKNLKELTGKKESSDWDDKDAGDAQSVRFFDFLNDTYCKDWRNDLTIQLTKAEAEYLKTRIGQEAGDSLFNYLLNNKGKALSSCGSFQDLYDIIDDEKLKADYKMAFDFGNFVHVLWVIYNVIVSNGESDKAKVELDKLSPNLKEYSKIDIEEIYGRLNLSPDTNKTHGKLKEFLVDTQKAMNAGNVEELKRLVIEREKRLKRESRARTLHPEAFDGKWHCGDYPDFRFRQAKQIIEDILAGEDSDV